MPFVSIKFVKENIASDPGAKMARIAERVSAAVSEEMGVKQSDVWVVFEAIGAAEFHVGGDSVEAIRARRT